MILELEALSFVRKKENLQSNSYPLFDQKPLLEVLNNHENNFDRILFHS